MKKVVLLTIFALSVFFVNTSIAGDDGGRCFEFVYPLTFEKSDGSTVVVKDEEAMVSYKTSWKEMDVSPALRFPIEVKWEGREAMSVESQEVLDRHWARCKAKSDSDSGSKKCFSMIYPVTFLAAGEKVKIASLEEMTIQKKEWSEKQIVSEIYYPIAIQWEGKEPIRVNTDEEMRSWRMKCRDL